MHIKQKLIGVGIGLFLVSAGAVWAFAAPGATGSTPKPATAVVSGATDTATPVATDTPAATETPEPTAVGTPDGCNTENDGAHEDATPGASATPDPCNVEEEGEAGDGAHLDVQDSQTDPAETPGAEDHQDAEPVGTPEG